ncbi:MAG: Holliday junction branch migration protein RuvA [Edaphocola sp.]
MFGYLEGKLVSLQPTHTYLDVGGVAYDVQLTLNTYEQIAGKETCKLFTHLQIREDAWVLYGFATEAEREAFRTLLSVSGVGAATARVLLSGLTANNLSRMVANGDAKALEKVKGIGAKTAQRIILELRGKLAEPEQPEINNNGHNTIANDALVALMGLGIGKTMAETAVKKALTLAGDSGTSVEDLIKSALKNM